MISAEEALRLADMIANATGGGWNDDAVNQLADQIAGWDDPGAAYAAADGIARTWTKEWRPSFGVIHGAYNEEAAKARRAEAHVRAVERPQCDGTGWNSSPIGMVPCKRCNPYLRDVYDDAPLWERFMNGEKLSELHDQVTVADRKMVGASGMPSACKPDLVHGP